MPIRSYDWYRDPTRCIAPPRYNANDWLWMDPNVTVTATTTSGWEYTGTNYAWPTSTYTGTSTANTATFTPTYAYSPTYTYSGLSYGTDRAWQAWVAEVDYRQQRRMPRVEYVPESVAVVREAGQRARALLHSLLTPEQRSELTHHKRFHVVGSHGRRYRIDCSAGQAGNVEVLGDNGRMVARACCHPSGVPDPDGWIAQKLAIETDEEEFLRIANVTGVVPRSLVAA